MLFKLSKGATNLRGSVKAAVPHLCMWCQQLQHPPKLCPALSAPRERRLGLPATAGAHYPGSSASQCKLEQPPGFLSVTCPSPRDVQMLGFVWQLGMCDKCGGDPGWFVRVCKRLSLLWRVCIISTINISLWEVCLLSRSYVSWQKQIVFYLNARRVFKTK